MNQQEMNQNRTETVLPVTREHLDAWALDPGAFVALHLKRILVPVESEDGEPGVVYPPTYADIKIKYNIDTMSDGKKVALVDSIGSQANRMEPIFIEGKDDEPNNPLAQLVPQIYVVLYEQSAANGTIHKEKRSIMELAHRGADAVVVSSPELFEKISPAFSTLRRDGNAFPLCTISPTSLVFGVWDSRGTGEKRPRLVRSIIRAWDVEELHVSAQFNSVWKSLSDQQKDALERESSKNNRHKLSGVGLKDAPAPYTPGGVLVKDRIQQDITVNLVALRGLKGGNEAETVHLRKYLLGLSLLAALWDMDLFLREGCHLRCTGDDRWFGVPRRGQRVRVGLESSETRDMIYEYTRQTAEFFKPHWPEVREYRFDINKAKKLLAKQKDEDGE